ncbi:MAG: alpha/beta fold hydrolase [Candidatus Bathyarchaeia archaeon]|jgi:3-oxoadipate enol-lactonase
MKTTVNAIDVSFFDVGIPDALPIVLIHGFPFSHEMWDPQIQAFQKRFRVIAYDLRGHGKSGVGDGQYTLEFFVDDLLALLDYLKIGKAVLCGLSMGGYIALRAVERNPERVIGLILADTQAKADSNEAKLKRAATIKSVKANGVNAYAEAFVKSVFAPQTFTSDMAAVEKIRQVIRANSSLGICGALLALASRTDTTEALSSIRVPTLILVGEHDLLTPPSASEEMHSRIPNSEIHVIPNAAHLSNLENSDEFNIHVLNFVDRLVR